MSENFRFCIARVAFALMHPCLASRYQRLTGLAPRDRVPAHPDYAGRPALTVLLVVTTTFLCKCSLLLLFIPLENATLASPTHHTCHGVLIGEPKLSSWGTSSLLLHCSHTMAPS